MSKLKLSKKKGINFVSPKNTDSIKEESTPGSANNTGRKLSSRGKTARKFSLSSNS